MAVDHFISISAHGIAIHALCDFKIKYFEFITTMPVSKCKTRRLWNCDDLQRFGMAQVVIVIDVD
jgi:hypothetical protein